MSKHTQQEWRRDGTTVYALNVEGTNRFVAQVQGGWATQGRNRTEAEEIEANARLIAAAPSMLHTLIECERVLARLDTIRHLDPDWPILDEVRAQIAKATSP